MRSASSRAGARAPAALVAIGVVVATFAAMALLRWHDGLSNVDDYLYATQTRAYFDALPSPGSLIDAWRAYGSNTPLFPTLALPLAAFDTSPDWLVLAQLVPLLVLVASVRSLLGSLGLSPRAAWAGAAGIGLLAPVMSYASMVHFGVAAAACAALALAAYARSDRLARTRPALVFGLALGLLAVSRVMAPVYVVAVVVPVAVDVLAGVDRARLRGAALAAVAGAVVAAPWWLASGGIAWDYLTSAGYGESFATREASRPEIARERLDWTADESGWLLSVVLVLLLVQAAVCLRRRTEGWRVLACVLGACVVGMAFLATSSNAGTAFALPFVVLGACAALAGAARLRAPLWSGALAACVAAVVLPALAMLGVLPAASVAGQPLWNERIPSFAQARAALGCSSCEAPDTDDLHRDVARIVGGAPTLVARADAVLNPEGLRHFGAVRIAAPATAGTVTARDLAGVRSVISGATWAPYIAPPADRVAFADLLLRSGFRQVFARRLSREGNSVVVWERR